MQFDRAASGVPFRAWAFLASFGSGGGPEGRRSPSPGCLGVATDLLFVYGTLMRGFALHRLIEDDAELIGLGQVEARLLDLGPYPAAVRDAGAAVRGELYRVLRPTLWRALDSTEGPQYHRQEVTVGLEGGRTATAFIYWYTGPLGGGVPIPGGDYRAHSPARSIYHQPSS